MGTKRRQKWGDHMKAYIIKIDGKIVKGFDGEPIGRTGDKQGWYTTANSELGTIEYTDDINKAYLVEGRFNFRSVIDRIYDRMSLQGLEFSRLEFVDIEDY